jgi:hypothetical protein
MDLLPDKIKEHMKLISTKAEKRSSLATRLVEDTKFISDSAPFTVLSL